MRIRLSCTLHFLYTTANTQLNARSHSASDLYKKDVFRARTVGGKTKYTSTVHVGFVFILVYPIYKSSRISYIGRFVSINEEMYAM